jgi:hypothetical protein
MHAGVRGPSPVKPGDFFLWRGPGGALSGGVALAVSPAGEPVKTFTSSEKGVLGIREETVPLAALSEVITLSLEPRELAEEAPAQAFYGTPSALQEFVGRRNPGTQWEDQLLGGDKKTLQYKEPQDLAKLLTLKAPGWVAERLLRRGKLEGIRFAADTLGEGLVRYAPGTPLPSGTWVFLKGDTFGVVVSTQPDGQPGAVLTHTAGGLEFVRFDAASTDTSWRPSVTPRRYIAEANDAAYTDLNGELGRLRLWAYAMGDESTYENPFFKHAASFGEARMQPELQVLLKDGPTGTNDWMAYLMDFGEGVQPAGSPRPGDFLFLRGGGRGVLLDRGEMIWWANQRIRLEPARDVKYVWRPTARRREASAA